MPEYYCHECSRILGLITPVDPTAVSLTQYHLDKFMKHTAPAQVYPVNSVFLDQHWSSYQNYMVSVTASGCLEIDDAGRKNLIFYAGQATGLKYNSGAFAATCSGVQVVCGEDSGRIHAFPTDFTPGSRKCKGCGRDVPFNA